MSTRRARVQYGKASKRVNSRLASTATSGPIHEEEVAIIEPATPQAAAQVTKIRNKPVKSDVLEDTKRVHKRDNTKGSRSPTRGQSNKALSSTPTRKRKRDPSPASSDLTDAVEEPAPVTKASKRATSDMTPVKKVNYTGGSKATPQIAKTPSRPSTPNEAVVHTPKLTRDLSDLFISPHGSNAVPSSPPKPGNLKRMLSKAKSESVLEPVSSLQSSDLFSSKTVVTPSTSPQKEFVLPSAALNRNPPSFNRNPLARNRTPSPPRKFATPPPVPRSPQKVGRTYSRSRLFLVEIPHDESMDVDGEPGSPSGKKKRSPHEDDEIHRESMSDLRSRWGLHDSEQDPTLNTPINDLNSVGEMRSRGETRRFLDEVGYLLDGLDLSSGKVNTAGKRASAIEIVSKLGDSEFFRRAAAADFVGKAWTALRGSGAGTGLDKILDGALIAFAAIATRDPRQAIELVRTRDFLPFLAMSISIKAEDDVLVPPPAEQEAIWARRQGLSRVDRTSLMILRTAIEKGHVVNETEVASSRLLASDSMVKIMELGQAFKSDLSDAVVESLVSELSIFPSLLSAPTDDDIAQHDFRHIRNCLRIAESTSINGADWQDTEASKDRKALLNLLAQYVNLWPSQLAPQHASKGIDSTIDITLRYLITSTHDNIPMCNTLSSSPNFLHNLLRLFIRWYRLYFDGLGSHSQPTSKDEGDDEDQSGVLERVSLSLGLLTQLVKHSDAAKSMIRTIKLSASCPASGRCIEQCQCPKRISGVQVLAEVFNRSDDGLNVAAEAKAHFLRGNISVLLGLLCLHEEPDREEVLARLKPTHASNDLKIRGLIEVIREFSNLLSDVVVAVESQEQAADEDDARRAADPIIAKAQAGMDEGVQVAQKVIDGLESLL